MERPYVYQALTPPHGIRLLRLLAGADGSLHGTLLECNIKDFYGQPNAYDALSYVWGDPKASHSILIDGSRLPITANLHAALAHLRSPYHDRLLWADAICINQENDREKEWQIGLMYQIYACASCVIVWLGEHEDGSEHVLEDLHLRRQKKTIDSQTRAPGSQRIIKLFQRAWFRRVWVLQEVGAARRVQVRWGDSVMDGSAFCTAADPLMSRLSKAGTAREGSRKVQSTGRFIPYLIQRSIYRPPYRGHKGTSDGICGFAELIDMFLTGEATKAQDKVYALLGMSSKDMSRSGLLPDYTIPFSELLKRVIKFVISDRLSISCQDSTDAAIIQTNGYVLATIEDIRDDLPSPQRQRIRLNLSQNTYSDYGYSSTSSEWDYSVYEEHVGPVYDNFWFIQASSIPLRKGDLICHLDGATYPTVIRLCHDYSVLLIAAVSRNNIEASEVKERLKWQAHIKRQRLPRRTFSLIWDWSYSSHLHAETYATWAGSKAWMSDAIWPTQKNIDNLARRCDCALLYADANGIHSSQQRFTEVLSDFESILQSEESNTEGREAFSSFLDRLRSRCVETPGQESLFQSSQNEFRHGDTGEEYSSELVGKHELQYSSFLFHWAAEKRYGHVTRLLFETNKVDMNFGRFHSYQVLSSLAIAGCRDLVQRVLAEETHGADTIDQALPSAVIGGHRGIIEDLLEEADAKKYPFADGMDSALKEAAEQGNIALVERLVQAANTRGRRTYRGYTVVDHTSALTTAAGQGNLVLIELLLKEGYTKELSHALLKAAKHGHLAVIERLLQAGADVNIEERRYGYGYQIGTTVLEKAAEGGSLAVFQRLFQAKSCRKQVVSPEELQKALRAAAAAGHDTIVEALLQLVVADMSSVLTAAATEGHLHVVERLVQVGVADVSLALSSAAKRGHLPVVERLLRTRETNLDFPLRDAAIGGHLPVVEWLVQAGANVNYHEDDWVRKHLTPLTAAATAGHLDIVDYLLKAGADANYQHNHGPTPLIAAAAAGHLSVVTRLLEAGADPTRTQGTTRKRWNSTVDSECSRRDYDSLDEAIRVVFRHRTAQQIASKKGYREIVERIEEAADAMDSESARGLDSNL